MVRASREDRKVKPTFSFQRPRSMLLNTLVRSLGSAAAF